MNIRNSSPERGRNPASLLCYILSMLIFGTVGILRKYIPLPSSLICFARGAIGASALFLLGVLVRRRPDRASLKKNLPWLLVSAFFLAGNWLLLFEACRLTTVAVATLCYYMAPVILMLLSPLLFHEKLTLKKLLCVAAALLGMLFVADVFHGGKGENDVAGILLGLAAALFYAGVVVSNRRIRSMDAFDRTSFQLLIASLLLLPYILLTEDLSALALSPDALLLLSVAGILHTGIAYALYFGSMGQLPVQTVAILSYIDPATAVLISPLFLADEKYTLPVLLGALLIIASSVISETGKKQ